MEIRLKETGAVITESEFRALHPNTGFPNQLTEQIINDFGGDVVFEGPQAQPTRYQVAFRDGIVEMDGKWYTKYSVADMEQDAKSALDAQQAKSMREQRNAKVGSIQVTPELANDPAALKRFTDAQGELSSALSRLLVVTDGCKAI